MKIYYGLEEFKPVKNPVVTIGTFDGVHLGHKKIINRLREIATNINGETVIFTFPFHPRLVLFPDDNNLRLLNTIEEKSELLSDAGVDHLIIHPFTKEFSRLTATDFVRDILVNKIGTKKLVIGYNHQFGRNREGSFENLKEFGFTYGFDVEEISALDMDNVKISSTKIREALLHGDVETASRYLGYDYPLSGIVVHNSKMGRSIGFPTANIIPPDRYKLIPAGGVYAVNVFFEDKEYKGMMNIGVKPTINAKNNRTLEVHIIDFDQNIYDCELKLTFKRKLRNEIKFGSLDELKRQLEEDKRNVLEEIRK